MKPRTHWDIFCTVVDNFGDIGICWRLARQLAAEHGLPVRLWVDDLAALRCLCPEIVTDADVQHWSGIEIRPWPASFPPAGAPDLQMGDVVIEAFACELPQGVIEAMARLAPPPRWINLEYLSAEPWVEDCHGLPSPHPRLPLAKHFFFPGFTARTGGLLRESGYERDRSRFDRDAMRQTLGMENTVPDPLLISLFGYEQPGTADLLDAWKNHPSPVRCLVPAGRIVADIARYFDVPTLAPGTTQHAGNLTLQVVPFVPQPDYDPQLWACDINFVRGEDSFVRALWAGRPMIWQIYPQADNAHRIKLDAFLDRYLDTAPAAVATAISRMWRAWNGDGALAAAWFDYASLLPAIADHSEAWARNLSKERDLVGNLVGFCEKSG